MLLVLVAQWLFHIIRDPRCNISFVVFILDIIKDVFTKYGSSLSVIDSPLSKIINEDLLPIVLRFLNIKNPEIYDRLLIIIESFIFKHAENFKEFLEIMLYEFFSVKRFGKDNLDLRLEFAPNLINGSNRFRTIDFLKRVIFMDGSVLLTQFANYDCEATMAPICHLTVNLCLALLQVTARAAGDRTYNSSEIALKCRIVDGLLALPTTLSLWTRNEGAKDHSDIARFLEANARRKKLASIVEKFNENAEEGIELAINEGVLPFDSLPSTAKFLRWTRGLDKKAIGEFLGRQDNTDLLGAYIETFNFKNEPFVECLRMFLEAFKLPGESQVVERYMEAFAQRLYKCNSQKFSDTDAFFQLAYSTLMLNTDLHSGSVKSKMTLEDFKKNTRRVVPITLVEDQMLVEIFEEISKSEIILENRLIEHPLPIGSREIESFILPATGTYVIPFLMEITDVWSKAIQKTLDDLHLWPDEFIQEIGVFKNKEDLLDVILVSIETILRLLGEFKLEQESLGLLENILATYVFLQSSPSHYAAFQWLEALGEKMGSSLGEAWLPVLKILSKERVTNISAGKPVSSKASVGGAEIITINIQHLNGQGILCFLHALFSIINTNPEFVRHNLLNICLGPPSLIEKILRASYEIIGASGHDSLFSLLSQIPSKGQHECYDVAFQLVQLVSKSHMPLILSLGNDAMFDYLQALEAFGVVSEVNVSIGAIEVFGNIAQLLFARNRGNGPKVEDEIFFLKWYHVLSGLGRIALEQTAVETSKLSIETLLGLLSEQGSVYGTGSWKVIWRSIIFSLLEDAQSKDDLLFIYLLRSAVDMLTRYEWFDEVYIHLLKLVELTCSGSIAKDYAQDGFLALTDLIKLSSVHGKRFTKYIWRSTVESLMRISQAICPTDLIFTSIDDGRTLPSPELTPDHVKLENTSTSTIPFPTLQENLNVNNSEVALIARKCVIQTFFLDTLKGLVEVEDDTNTTSLILGSQMGLQEAVNIVGILLRSFSFAQEFNRNIPLRRAMVQAGIVENLENAVLTRQETKSLTLAVQLLFQLHFNSISINRNLTMEFFDDPHAQILVTNKFNDVAMTVIRCFTEMRSPASDRRPGKSWNDLVLLVFDYWRQVYEHIDREKTSIEPNIRGLVERMTGLHFEAALELASFAGDRGSVNIVAKEFVRYSFKRLSKDYNDPI